MSHPFSPWRSDAPTTLSKYLPQAVDIFFFIFSASVTFDLDVSIWTDISEGRKSNLCSWFIDAYRSGLCMCGDEMMTKVFPYWFDWPQ